MTQYTLLSIRDVAVIQATFMLNYQFTYEILDQGYTGQQLQDFLQAYADNEEPSFKSTRADIIAQDILGVTIISQVPTENSTLFLTFAFPASHTLEGRLDVTGLQEPELSEAMQDYANTIELNYRSENSYIIQP